MIDMKEMAKQLRLPEGENSKMIADFMSKGNRAMYDYTFSKFKLQSKSKVLEIGPANGYFVNQLFEKNDTIHYTGLDLSLDMIREAINLNSELVTSGKAEFVFGDVIALPLDDSLFDVIFTVNTLYFWSDPKKGMSELRRVMKPNGKLVIAIRSKETMSKMPFTEFGFQLYSKSELEALFLDNGFANLELTSKTDEVILPSGEIAKMESFCAIGEKS